MSHVQTIALAQIAPKLGDVAANLACHRQYIAEAVAKQADVIVFPELGLTGYQLQDLTFNVARTLQHDDIVALVNASREIDVIFSFIEESDEHFFYVTGVYAAKGEIVHVHRKVYLPTYGMFDENRYVTSGSQVQPFRTEHGTAGMLICEDAWHVSVPYLHAMQGATMLYVPASSPGRNVMDEHDFGSHTFWRQLLQMYAQLFGTHIVFVNRVGYEDGVHFYGSSGVVGPEGRWLGEAGTSREALVTVTIDHRDVRRARYITPLVRDERLELTLNHLAKIQRK
ncbi:nitrilase-related carbon-nitrogen hydrolase [Alicyclobacillus dauci]|uniref:Acyltransferase n=1 Tax=Alicyclobacillus dauci TaxID=1475485 RepID=A0ABY6Z6G6_9BACL|nr:nitrilase-related carbon-nitrogen hydrolase [Alicyclobacillus dauci]WAH38417.1 acyltransferase [Alicyclobacillus dauci]